MDYNKLPSNSFDHKPAGTTTQPKVKGHLEPEKETEGKKIAKALIGGSFQDIAKHTIYDVLIPGVKRIVLDAISILLFGSPTAPRGSIGSSTPKVSYDGFWNKGVNTQPKATSMSTNNTSSSNGYIDPVFDTKEDVVLLQNDVSDWLDREGVITVAQFYQMAGIDNYPYTMNQFGWRGVTTIANSSIIERRDGDTIKYLLKMPRICALREEEWKK